MVKVVEFIESAIERLGGYGDSPRVLPALMHALYAPQPATPFTRSCKQVKFKNVRHVPFKDRKHKPHQMHSQFRLTCVKVLAILVKRMDIRTRQCVHVNPVKKKVRTLYVPEIARLTGLCDRTVTRALSSLVRAGYLFRDDKHRFYLSLSLFRDLKLSLTLERLANQLRGLASKNTKDPSSGSTKGKAPAKSQCDQPMPGPPKNPPKEPKPTRSSKEVGNRFLSGLPPGLRKPPS